MKLSTLPVRISGEKEGSHDSHRPWFAGVRNIDGHDRTLPLTFTSLDVFYFIQPHTLVSPVFALDQVVPIP